MLKRNITYTDFNDHTVTEEFHFHLSQSELIEMELGTEGGFAEALQNIIKNNDQGALIREFKKLVLKAYGRKSEDGKSFIKNEQMQQEFAQTAAYNALFMELATNSDAAAIFINGVVPKEMAIAIEKENAMLKSVAIDQQDPAFAAMKAAQTQLPPPMGTQSTPSI